ncbi:MAG: VCBS repeat-containing protein, partial [Sphingobacteriales bacterium]
WYYKSNLGNGDFTHALPVAAKPSFTGLSEKSVSLMDLSGNGVKYFVQTEKEPKGYYKLTEEEEWEPFKSFDKLPNINLLDQNLRAIDLTGDGMPDLLITEENTLRWYKGIGEHGFELSESVAKEIDEEKGPAIVFADLTQSVFLADMDGDGLTDIVRIRNGEICYWPNLGYGKFGSKVSMDNAPLFDHPDIFNPSYLRLADIDGSGNTDIIYLGKKDFRVWMNLSGNEWTTEPEIIEYFPDIHNLSDVAVLQ